MGLSPIRNESQLHLSDKGRISSFSTCISSKIFFSQTNHPIQTNFGEISVLCATTIGWSRIWLMLVPYLFSVASIFVFNAWKKLQK